MIQNLHHMKHQNHHLKKNHKNRAIKKIPKKEVSDIMENSKSPVLNLATKSNVRRAKIKANKNINRLVKSEK